jgi:hypothetical protein
MATVRRIGPGSAFKVGLVLYGIMGLLIGIIFAAVSMLGGALAPPAETGMFRMFFGAGAIVLLPICYGVIGGISGALGAVIYNLVAGWVGGLEVDIS